MLAALGIALAGLTALPAGQAAARPCPMPREPGEERPVCSIARAPQLSGLAGGTEGTDRSGEEIPTRGATPQFGGLSGGIEGTN
ncbi:MAG TPA: hypothetical protein VFO85_17490 [Vicinamibacteria bacterium]|nr:hypothetical protein [Vicinamibacteria bacterium]